MSDPSRSDRKADAAAADDRAEFTVSKFGRRRVGGPAWSWGRLGWVVLWPVRFFARRKDARGSYPKSKA
jgi:hypothetical protein